MHLPHGDAQGIAHNENEFYESKNCAPYDPRGIIEKGRLRAVQCRSPPLAALMLERGLPEQGKYEEERKKEFWKLGGKTGIYKLWSGGKGPTESAKVAELLKWDLALSVGT